LTFFTFFSAGGFPEDGPGLKSGHWGPASGSPLPGEPTYR